jgi:hypothetical protein
LVDLSCVQFSQCVTSNFLASFLAVQRSDGALTGTGYIQFAISAGRRLLATKNRDMITQSWLGHGTKTSRIWSRIPNYQKESPLGRTASSNPQT